MLTHQFDRKCITTDCFSATDHGILAPETVPVLCAQDVAGSDTVAFYHTSAHTKFSPNPAWWQNNPNCDQHVRCFRQRPQGFDLQWHRIHLDCAGLTSFGLYLS